MAIASLGVVGSVSALSQSGTIDIPISVDVPASSPTDGATIVMIFRCVGTPAGTRLGAFNPIASDSAALAGPYASCGVANPYTGAYQLENEQATLASAYQLVGSTLMGFVVLPLVAGTDFITYDEWNAEPSPPSEYDISIIVMAWTGVQSTTTTPVTGVDIAGALIADGSGHLGAQLNWQNSRISGITQADFPQSDFNNQMRIPPAGYGSVLPWQFDFADLDLRWVCDVGHDSNATISGVTWYDTDVSTVASILNFYSPLAAASYTVGDDYGPYMCCIVGQNAAPSTGTAGDFGVTFTGSGFLTGTEIGVGASILALTTGPGPAVCSGGLHIWQRI